MGEIVSSVSCANGLQTLNDPVYGGLYSYRDLYFYGGCGSSRVVEQPAYPPRRFAVSWEVTAVLSRLILQGSRSACCGWISCVPHPCRGHPSFSACSHIRRQGSSAFCCRICSSDDGRGPLKETFGWGRSPFQSGETACVFGREPDSPTTAEGGLGLRLLVPWQVLLLHRCGVRVWCGVRRPSRMRVSTRPASKCLCTYQY